MVKQRRRRRRKKSKKTYQYGSGAPKLPYPIYTAPYYQRGYGLPEFWKCSVVPLWHKIRKPLSKALTFGGRVLHDQAHKGYSLSKAVGSNLPELIGNNIKPKKKPTHGRRKTGVKQKGRGGNIQDIFS